MTYILIMASSSDTSRADWKLPPNYPLILPFGAIIGHPLLTREYKQKQIRQHKSIALPPECMYFTLVLTLISIENSIQKQNKYSYKVNKRVSIVWYILYIFDVDSIVGIHFVNILFLTVFFFSQSLCRKTRIFEREVQPVT